MGPENSNRVELARLLGDFPGEPALGETWLQPGDLQEPANTLLVHHHHMTVTLEAHYGGPVVLLALARRLEGQTYSRKLLLKDSGSGKVILFGIVRIHLDLVTDQVRELIMEEKIPLGRLLIDQGVLRRVERTALLSYPIRQVDRERFQVGNEIQDGTPIYGRLAMLYCDGKPAIELLEVVRPVAPTGGER